MPTKTAEITVPTTIPTGRSTMLTAKKRAKRARYQHEGQPYKLPTKGSTVPTTNNNVTECNRMFELAFNPPSGSHLRECCTRATMSDRLKCVSYNTQLERIRQKSEMIGEVVCRLLNGVANSCWSWLIGSLLHITGRTVLRHDGYLGWLNTRNLLQC